MFVMVVLIVVLFWLDWKWGVSLMVIGLLFLWYVYIVGLLKCVG